WSSDVCSSDLSSVSGVYSVTPSASTTIRTALQYSSAAWAMMLSISSRFVATGLYGVVGSACSGAWAAGTGSSVQPARPSSTARPAVSGRTQRYIVLMLLGPPSAERTRQDRTRIRDARAHCHGLGPYARRHLC